MPLARPLATAFSRRTRRHAMNTKRAHRSRARTTPPRARRAHPATPEDRSSQRSPAPRGSIGNPRPRSRARRVRRARRTRGGRARELRSFVRTSSSSFFPKIPNIPTSRRPRRRAGGVDTQGMREGCDSMVTYLPADTSNKKSAAQLRRSSLRACWRHPGGSVAGDDLALVRSGLERGEVGGETEFVALPVGHVTARTLDDGPSAM